MAIKHLFARGIGFNDSQIGWVVTRGYGTLASAATIYRYGRLRVTRAAAAIQRMFRRR